MNLKRLAWGVALAAFAMGGCSSVADGEEVEIAPPSSSSQKQDSDKNPSSSSIFEDSSSSQAADSTGAKLDSLLQLVSIPASTLKRGTTVYSTEAFKISSVETSQKLYRDVMGELPTIDKTGDDVPVVNVSWYSAALFCNALSKKMNLDTAYIYQGVLVSGELDGVEIDYSAKALRLPTETEWEVAYRAGSTTTYYWDVAVASQFAYYGQTSGPVKSASYKPNEYGLYDMGGNVAEWVNDWYGPYSVQDEANPVGASDGELRVIRGGGWSDKVTALAASERNKKDPQYKSQMLGIRIVYSTGFSKSL